MPGQMSETERDKRLRAGLSFFEKDHALLLALGIG